MNIEQVQAEQAGMPGISKTRLDPDPIDRGAVVILKLVQVEYGTQRRPNALIVGMLYLRMHDEVRHEVSRRRYANPEPIYLQRRRMRDDFARR